MPPTALPGTRLKYVRARMPGSEIVHLVPADRLELDSRFGDADEFVRAPGPVSTPCGRKSDVWIVDARGQSDCELCASRR